MSETAQYVLMFICLGVQLIALIACGIWMWLNDPWRAKN